MLQTTEERTVKARFSLRTQLGLISRYAEGMFSQALDTYKSKSGALTMFQSPSTENIQPSPDIHNFQTLPYVPAIKLPRPMVSAPADPPTPALLKFSAPGLPPLLALEAAIHQHLEKCRSLPAVLYVDSQTFLPALSEQYQRIKFCEFDNRYYYFTGHQLVSIVIATEKELTGWARANLGGSIPADMVISAMSL